MGILTIISPGILNAQRQSHTNNADLVNCPTKYLESRGVRFAYREYGPEGGVPLLLINRFRGNLDDWDPLLLGSLSEHRRVISFDDSGFASSVGTPPATLEGLANDAANFLRALNIQKVDVLGFSYGGYTAAELALIRPDLVRRLILASSGPGFVEDSPIEPKVFGVAGKPVNSADDLLFSSLVKVQTVKRRARNT